MTLVASPRRCQIYRPGTCRHQAPLAELTLVSLLMLFLLAPTLAIGETPPSAGGPLDIPQQEECLTEFERQRIRDMLDDNVELLHHLGQLPEPTEGTISLSWPLAAADNLSDDSYYFVGNYVDLDPAFPDQLLDYSCGERTYDRDTGYNHSGIDYVTWPFWWYKMDNDQVEIVAAAPGTLIGKDDGNPDRSCSFGGTWNAAYIQHADGSTAWYGHMKNGTVTTKPVGSPIAAGEYLGIVGSSGSSTVPHLHFEVHDSDDDVVEPYNGTCQTDPTWWDDQRPYYDSAINLIATHDEMPVFPTCPMTETPNLETHFDPGATVHVALYFRDYLAGQVVDMNMVMPDGNVWQNWQHVYNDLPHLAGAYWVWTWFMPVAPEGWWTFEATYDGVTYSTRFAMGSGIFADGFESGDTSAWSVSSP